MICNVEREDIQALTDTDLRDLVGILCIAELYESHESISGVTYGGSQDAADEGVDVRVAMSRTPQENSNIPKQSTIFQVKKPGMSSAKIVEEMRPGGFLRTSIGTLAENNGAYIIVSSGDKCSDSMLRNRRKAMRDCFGDTPQAENVYIDFFDCQRLADWTNLYPFASLWVYRHIGKNILSGWQSYCNWSGGTKSVYLYDESIRISQYPSNNQKLTILQTLDDIRDALSNIRASVRLVGLSGVGKTRFLEALFDETLGCKALPQTLALYTDMGHNPQPAPIHLAEELLTIGKRAILVIDNCSTREHRTLTEICKRDKSKLSLITVEYDIREDIPPETEVYVMESSSDDVVKRLISLRYPGINEIDIETIVEFSGGNARIAIALASACGSGVTIHGLGDAQLVERLIYQTGANDERIYRSAKVLSLVYSFNGDYNDPAGELSVLAKIVGVTENELFEYCRQLEDRGLVQSRAPYKALLPHAVANRLAKEALHFFPIDFLFDMFAEPTNVRLLRSFCHRLGYLHDSTDAVNISRKILGFISQAGYPTVSDSLHCMVTYLAPIVPHEVMSLIGDAIYPEGVAILLKYRASVDYTRLVVQLGYYSELFDLVTKTLVKFAKHKAIAFPYVSEHTLLNYFQPYLSGTHASPEQRQETLRWMLDSTSNFVRQLGLKALDKSLATSFFSGNSYSILNFGSHIRDYGYHPNSDQLKKWYISFLSFASEVICSDQVNSQEVKGIMAKNFRGLCKHGMLSEIEQASSKICALTTWFDGWLACISVLRLDSEKLSPDIIARVMALKNTLCPISINEQIQAYTLTQGFHLLDFNFELTQEKNIHNRLAVEAHLVDLGIAMGEDKSLFNQLLPALIEQNVENGSNLKYLGIGFAATCDPAQSWSSILNALLSCKSECSYPNFVGGFFEGISKRDSRFIEKMSMDIEGTPEMYKFALILYYNDPSENSYKRLLAFLQKHTDVPWRYTDFPSSQDYQNEQICIELIDALYLRGDSHETILQLIRMNTPEFGSETSNWTIYKKRIMEHFSDIQFLDLKINDSAMEDMGEIILYSYDEADSREQLQLIAMKIHDALIAMKSISELDCWGILKGIAIADTGVFLDGFLPDSEEVTYNIGRSIFNTFSSSSIMDFCDLETLKLWVNHNPKERLEKIAGLLDMIEVRDGIASIKEIASFIINHQNVSCSILVMLEKHIEPSSWSGNLSDILRLRKPILETLTSYPNSEVSSWAKKVVEYIDKRIPILEKCEQEWNRNTIHPFEP